MSRGMATEEIQSLAIVDVNRNLAQLSLANFQFVTAGATASEESQQCGSALLTETTLSGENNSPRLHQSVQPSGESSMMDGRWCTLPATSNDDIIAVAITNTNSTTAAAATATAFKCGSPVADRLMESSDPGNNNGNRLLGNGSSSLPASHNTTLPHRHVSHQLDGSEGHSLFGEAIGKVNQLGRNVSTGKDGHHAEQMAQINSPVNTLHGLPTLSNNQMGTEDSVDSRDHSKDSASHPKPFSSIPGPWPSLPFIGTGWQYFYLVGRYDLNKLHCAHIDRYLTYGPIVREEYQWGKAIVHIYDPTDFETILRSQGRCPVRPANEFVSQLRQSKPHMYPNVGFANLNGPEWLNLRQKLAPAIMKLRTINESMHGQNAVCDDFLEYLWQVKDPETHIVGNLQEASYRLALESICLMCLDSRIGSFPQYVGEQSAQVQDGDVLIEATKMMFDSFNKLYYGLPFWKYFPTTAYSNLDKAETTIYEITSKYIEKEMDVILNGEDVYDSNESVLKTLLKITKENPKELSKEEVKITLMDFIIGGIFSVSNSLVYLFYHLAANPEVQEKLYREIDSILGDSACQPDSVDSSHLANMPYLKACVNESFRLNCPVPGIMRVTTEPIVLSGYHIPANTPVFSHCMTTCRLEAYFKDAHRFWPERWTSGSGQAEQNHPFALMPFGFGRRMCVGKRFSENEINLATVRLLKTYRLELADAVGEELELRHAFMVIPANPISLRITRRST